MIMIMYIHSSDLHSSVYNGSLNETSNIDRYISENVTDLEKHSQ